MSVDWEQLAVDKAKELGAADPEKAAALILLALKPEFMLDDACITINDGVPSGDDEPRCVNYKAHRGRFDSEQTAWEAWRDGDVLEEHRLEECYPCASVELDAVDNFILSIELQWGLFDGSNTLLEDVAYIQDHIEEVPIGLQEKWDNEFRIIFGRQATFGELDEKEAHWLRQRVASFHSSRPKTRNMGPGKSRGA